MIEEDINVLLRPSSAISNSSYIFSPGLIPVNTILISLSSLYPLILIKFFARSNILTGSPMSNTKISPPFAITPASIKKKKKIFISKPINIDDEKLNNNLKLLGKVITEEDRSLIDEIIKKIVPTYEIWNDMHEIASTK